MNYKSKQNRNENQFEFIRYVLSGDIAINKEDLVWDLRTMKFNDEPGRDSSGYEYLLSCEIKSLTIDKLLDLEKILKEVKDQIKRLEREAAKSLWLEDLAALKKALEEKEKRDKGEDDVLAHSLDSFPEKSQEMETDAPKAAAAAVAVAKKPLTEVEDISNDDDDDDGNFELKTSGPVRKGRGRPANCNAPKEAAVTKKRNLITDSFNIEASDSTEMSSMNKVRRKEPKEPALEKMNQAESSSTSPNSTENEGLWFM